MAKEYLKKLEYLGDYIIGDCKLKSHKYYKELHNYLEAINNANPSEALKCVDKLEQVIEEITIYNADLRNTLKASVSLAIIKQALLKAQEPKHYLKWEDLEFEKKQQVMNVLLNGKPYILYFYKLATQTEVNMFAIDMHIVTLNSYYPEDVQFFNDLHLEVVEE